MERAEDDFVGRRVFRPLGELVEVVGLQRDPVVRVRLLPSLLYERVIVRFGGEDAWQEAIVLQHPIANLDRPLPVLVTRAVHVGAGCRDVDRERLAPGTSTRLEYVDQFAVREDVVFVDQHATRVVTVFRSGFA